MQQPVELSNHLHRDPWPKLATHLSSYNADAPRARLVADEKGRGVVS